MPPVTAAAYPLAAREVGAMPYRPIRQQRQPGWRLRMLILRGAGGAYPPRAGECEVSAWPHSLCAHLRQTGAARCVYELWEKPLEARLFVRCDAALREVHARQLRLHDRLLRAAVLTLRGG